MTGGGIKGGLKRITDGADLTHPKLSVWYVLGLIVAVFVLLIGWKYGQKLLGKTEALVGQSTPGAAGKGDIRSRLGI